MAIVIGGGGLQGEAKFIPLPPKSPEKPVPQEGRVPTPEETEALQKFYGRSLKPVVSTESPRQKPVISGMVYDGILPAPPRFCPSCRRDLGEMVDKRTLTATLPVKNPLHGKIPYQCKNIACRKIYFAPSRVPRGRCC